MCVKGGSYSNRGPNVGRRRGHMLSDNNAIGTVGVQNLEKSKEFYERTLGLTRVMENDEVLAFKSGASLDDHRSPKHVHPANEADLAGTLRREFDDDWFVERQRTPDIQQWKDHLRSARLVRR